jgi:large subunit ribosomal protein L7Ae
MTEFSQEKISKAFEAIELAKKTGKIKKGANEVTKVVEKGTAKLVVVAQDVSPKEIIMHLEPLCKEKNIPYIEVPTKDDLGAAASLRVGTASVAVVKEGEAKNAIKELS